MLQITALEMAVGPAADHIGVHLDHHLTLRVVPQCVAQHLLETLRPRQPQSDGAVAGGLIHHQHKRSTGGR